MARFEGGRVGAQHPVTFDISKAQSSHPRNRGIHRVIKLAMVERPNDQKLIPAAGDFRQPETRLEN